MSKAKWLLIFLVALGMSVPAMAVELSLGGFPSYMRTRARYINNATFINTLSDSQAEALGFADADDEIFFVDTTLRLTPQLVLSDSVTIRAQVDVFQNNLWGGATSALLGGGTTRVNSAISPDDSFRGAFLTGERALDRDNQFFDIRMLHADIVLPNNLGFVRVGRQPFDWGIGILANGGWDPYSDLGFLTDRFLWLKTFPAGNSNITLVLVSDMLNGGSSTFVGTGSGYDILAGALIFNNPNMGGVDVTIGAYTFPYIHQDNVGTPRPLTGDAFDGSFDLDQFWLNSGLIDLKTDLWRLVGEVQHGWGELDVGGTTVDIDHQFLWAVRGELYPNWPIKTLGAEFGWSDGDDGATGDLEGQVIVFNPAYNIDNLLFKHMIPNIYGQEGSVINAFYARAYGTVKLMDHLSWSPQALVAWNDETDAVLTLNDGSAAVADVDRFLGVEVESTLTWHVVPGVNFDVIGSLVIAGQGLEDLLEAQGAAETGENVGSADSLPWAVQGRLMVFIDQFFK